VTSCLHILLLVDCGSDGLTNAMRDWAIANVNVRLWSQRVFGCVSTLRC